MGSSSADVDSDGLSSECSYSPSVEKYSIPTSSVAGDGASNSSLNVELQPSTCRLPSFCNLEGSTGLQPSRNPFDVRIIRKLENLFDDTTVEVVDEEKLKTFLRIRPSSDGDAKPRAKQLKDAMKVLEVKDETTVVTCPMQKTVNSFSYRSRVHAERNKKTEFKFTKVLGPETTQSAVFEECVNPLIERFLKNENCLIFSYGATNSGKTYTLQGHGTDYGIIPRTLDALFTRIQDRLFKQGDIKPHLYQTFHHLSVREVEFLQGRKEEILTEAANIKTELRNIKENISFAGSQSSSQESSVNLAAGVEFSEMNYALFANTTMFSVWVSFAELYNEKVYDLLEAILVGKAKRRKERRLLQDKDGFVYIKDLTELHVTSEDEAYKVFLAGRKNLQFAATQMNQRSSRSHSFFTIRVVSIGIGEGLTPFPKSVHRMTFCDLAGMERAYQTENEGARLKESSNINISLTVLLKVIRLLREKQVHGNGAIETIPFRESKLTHIFKSYLTSSTHICMIVNVNPDPKMADSTLQVLHNSAIASNVIVFRTVEPEPEEEKQPQRKYISIKNRTHKPTACGKENEIPTKFLKPKNQPAKTAFDSTSSSQSDADNYPKNVQFAGFDSSPDNSDSDHKGRTVIATNKLYQQRIAALEQQVMDLKMKIAKCELEKQQIRDECVKMLADQNRLWTARYTEYKLSEENICRRKLSLMNTPKTISPGSKCGRNHTPPTVYMENILEDEDSDENENASIIENIPYDTNDKGGMKKVL